MNKYLNLLLIGLVVFAAACSRKPEESSPRVAEKKSKPEKVAKPVEGEKKKPALTPAQKVFRNAAAMSPPSDRIRICTYNIQDFTDGIDDGYGKTSKMVERQMSNAAKIIESVSPHLMVMQEIENGKAIKRLNAKMSTPFPGCYVTDFKSSYRRKLNVALMTSLPVENVVQLTFKDWDHPAEPPRGAIRCEVPLEKGRGLLVYGVHLKSNHGERPRNVAKRRAALEILRNDSDEFIAQNKDTVWEVVIAGDYNVDPESPGFKNDKTLADMDGWVDIWLGTPLEERTTLPARMGDPDLLFPPVAFDRFLVIDELSTAPWIAERPRVMTAGVETNNVYVKPGQSELHVSDHYPAYFDILREQVEVESAAEGESAIEHSPSDQ